MQLLRAIDTQAVRAECSGQTCTQVRLASIAENSFNAVERIDEIAHISEEAEEELEGSKPDGWPKQGKVCCSLSAPGAAVPCWTATGLLEVLSNHVSSSGVLCHLVCPLLSHTR